MFATKALRRNFEPQAATPPITRARHSKLFILNDNFFGRCLLCPLLLIRPLRSFFSAHVGDVHVLSFRFVRSRSCPSAAAARPAARHNSNRHTADEYSLFVCSKRPNQGQWHCIALHSTPLPSLCHPLSRFVDSSAAVCRRPLLSVRSFAVDEVFPSSLQSCSHVQTSWRADRHRGWLLLAP